MKRSTMPEEFRLEQTEHVPVQDLIAAYERRWAEDGLTWFSATALEALVWMATEVGEALDACLRQDPKWIRNHPTEAPSDEEVAEEIFDAIMMGCIALTRLGVNLEEVAAEKLARMDKKRRRAQGAG